MKPHRDTIFLEEAEILAHQAFEGNQYILRVHAPDIAQRARAGSFAHITCDPQRPMRRPISIMRVLPQNGEIEFLYKAFGEGTALLAKRQVGERLSILGPIGKPFELHANRPRPLLIGGGVGMPPMVFVADTIRQQQTDFFPFMILGSEVPFPFTTQPSEFLIPGMPAGVVATMPLMEDWHIPCRLASTQGYAGCFEGYVTDLARIWLDSLTEDQRQQVEVFACGPHPMLEAVARLAQDYSLPCQVSLEEFMACAVGGCAGCVVEVQTDNGPAMQRVCVDGPVFEAHRVFG
ncbi:MAG: dihydroorotate dehydrogenase electron transfer subunit [Thiohalomonadales bacterium]|nr:dihydroorotate dehydrogenase electron transfer subunit [Thiohalomonadales bacterium]